MIEDKVTSEKIELWLDGMLSKEETHAFEVRIDADPELQHKVTLHRRARIEIEDAVYRDFRRNAANWRDDLDSLPPPPIDLDVPANLWLVWIRRIFLGMLLLGLLPIIPGPSSESFKSASASTDSTKAGFGGPGVGSFGDETGSKNDPSSLESGISSFKSQNNGRNNLIGNEIIPFLQISNTSFNVDTSTTVTSDSLNLKNNAVGVDSTVRSFEPMHIKQNDSNQAIPAFPPSKIKKNTIAIAPFTFSKSVSVADAEVVSKEVSGYIVGCGQLTVVNRADLQFINAERELQKGEDFIDGKVIQQGVNLGVDFMLVGHVVTTSGDEGPVIHVSIVDVATTEVKVSEVISSKSRRTANVGKKVDDNLWNMYNITGSWKTVGHIKTAIAAIDGLKKLSGANPFEKQVKGFINEYFPLRIAIAKFDEIDNKKGVKTILLFANEKTGLKKGDNLKIVEASQIANPDGTTGTHEKEIGKAKVEYFEGNFTFCTVIKGGIDLVAKQGNTNVYLVKIK